MYRFVFYGDNSYIKSSLSPFIVAQNDIVVYLDFIINITTDENGFNNIVGITFNKDKGVYYEVEIYKERNGEMFLDAMSDNDGAICEFRRI